MVRRPLAKLVPRVTLRVNEGIIFPPCVGGPVVSICLAVQVHRREATVDIEYLAQWLFDNVRARSYNACVLYRMKREKFHDSYRVTFD